MVLAGDIGGTSTRLGFFPLQGGLLRPLEQETYPSQKHAGLNEIVASFVARHKLKAQSACFGIAGPVRRNRVETPNLPWHVDAESLSKDLGGIPVKLINDLEANAFGIAALEPSDFVTINPGAKDAIGNAAVISAGTGLGEAGLFWDGARHHPFASEGGHSDLASRNNTEDELLRFLRTKFGRVSYERILSGPGLHSIYDFLLYTHRGEEPLALKEELKHGDSSSVISHAGLEGRYPICVKALDMFISFFGAEAGNLALKIMATGGVYIGGGIAPKIIKKLNSKSFMDSFMEKGRLTPLLETIPVRVVLNDLTALYGAARCATLQSSS